MDVSKGFNSVLDEKAEFFNTYTHEKPVVMTNKTFLETKKLGIILRKAIHYFINNYKEYQNIMPLCERTLNVLEVCSKYPFKLGTFRTDFLIDEDNQLKIIEMTTRQPLNGYFISGFSNHLGLLKAANLNIKGVIDVYSDFLNYFNAEVAHNKDTICIVKGNERLGDFKIYTEIFQKSGYEVHVIELEELPQKLDLLKNAAVIEELNHKEILSLPDEYIEILTEACVFNDFRNLFLLHDKRFFHVLTDERFLTKALDASEKEFLERYTIPSYVKNLHPEKYDAAYNDKDNWIIKPTLLGKSEDIYAGCITEEKKWKEIFNRSDIDKFVLQPLIKQKKFTGTIGSEDRDDFVAGTFLYFDDQYFGPGIYRASSCVITNFGDDRKLAQVVIDNNDVEIIEEGIHII